MRWRHGNRFRLRIDGAAFFPAMLDAIAAARRQILLEMYLVESGHVVDRFSAALTAAAARGVRVCLLLDDFGCRGLQTADRARLQQAGVELVLYNPLRLGGELRRNLFRDHRKLLVVDADCAFVGGAGLTDAFAPGDRPEAYWHEVMVEIRGPLVAEWQAVFARNWARWSRTGAVAVDPPGAPAGDQTGRVNLSGTGLRTPIKRSLLTRIGHARERVWLATAYFVPSWKLRRRLARAARRGVDVRLLLPGAHTDHPAVRHAGRRFYAGLLRAGVRVYEYQPRFQHAKLALVDTWASIGSSNLDRWNLRWNLEANQEVHAADFAAQTAALFETDFSDSLELHYASWGQRPWYGRLAEAFWGAVDRWVDRQAQR
ncbi:MAG: phosphatidylserine/phosphatidylglycerophosphate/cardiolipin synthase family protein [Gammaproteobacteria bacterium]